MRAIIDLAHANGGLCSINHPKVGGPAWEYGFDLPVDTLEVWQGPWPYRNDDSLALWDRLLRAGKQLRAVGGSDYHCPAGEDTNLLRLGQPTTWVHVKERSHRGIFEALYAGRASISAHTTGPRIELSAIASDGKIIGMGQVANASEEAELTVTATVCDGTGYTFQLVVDGEVQGQQMVSAPHQTFSRTIAVATYVRAELIGDLPKDLMPPDTPTNVDRRGWRWALSNPIFVAQ
jgi:hypothetical protein